VDARSGWRRMSVLDYLNEGDEFDGEEEDLLKDIAEAEVETKSAKPASKKVESTSRRRARSPPKGDQELTNKCLTMDQMLDYCFRIN